MVMDFDFTLLGEVPAPKSFMVRREFRGVGSFKLTVQRDAGGLLARDRVIYRPDRPEQGWIIHRVSRSGDTLTVDCKDGALTVSASQVFTGEVVDL